jgi:S-adenosylmethionine:tRNA ribosyltransferase-isomerase
MTAEALSLATRLEAHEPPEAHGVRRDGVRMMVSAGAKIEHAHAYDLPDYLAAGDLLVVNTSRTMPAALEATRRDGTRLKLHLSTPVREGGPNLWLVELRRGSSRFGDGRTGETLELPGGGSARLLAADVNRGRLWVCELRLPEPLLDYLDRHGRPITYGHTRREWPLAAYQTAFAGEPGSAEMPSAARPLTPELVASLVAHGILLAPVVLHTGVSSLELGERPYPERVRVPEATAWLATAVKRRGGRVIAVGTTVARALETAARPDGTVHAVSGWTELVIDPERGVYVLDGLLTGWHDPDSSHLLLLEAVAGPEVVERSYAEAVDAGYRWHEFGDSHLLLR